MLFKQTYNQQAKLDNFLLNIMHKFKKGRNLKQDLYQKITTAII